MATWNTDNPAVGNQITADIADIEENLQELHDVIAAITNGTLGTTTAADFQVDTISSPAMSLGRSRFVWKDADEIYIYAGAYHHYGTKSQIVYWNSALTSDIGSPDASDCYYLYLDDSAIVTAGTNLLTATEFVWSNTVPAWSDAKHGWYNGLDRCIFAVFTDGSSNILEFFHDGGELVVYGGDILEVAGEDIDTTFLDADLASSVPKFSTKAEITAGIVTEADGNVILYWRVNGASDAGGHILCGLTRIGTDQTIYCGGLKVFLDSSQIFEIKLSTNAADTVIIHTTGWYFPAGM